MSGDPRAMHNRYFWKGRGQMGWEKLDHNAKEAEYGEEAKEARGGFKNG